MLSRLSRRSENPHAFRLGSVKEFSNVPLQQSIRDLGQAFSNHFQSLKGERKGSVVGFPKFKKRSHSQSAKLTNNSFKVNQHTTYIAKVGKRELPSAKFL